MQGGIVEAGSGQHFLIFREGIGISFRGGAQHDEPESGGRRRGDAVLIGDELHNDDAPAGTQDGMNAAQEAI